MKVRAAPVERAAVIGRAAEERGEARAVERLDRVIAVVARELRRLGVVLGDAGRPVRGVDNPRTQVAGDGVPGDEAADERLRLLGHVPERPRPLATVLRLQPVLAATLARPDLPAVAPRGTPADAPGLEHHDIEAGLGKVQRRGEPGIAAADHADLGLDRAGERREGRDRRGGRGVPARGIFPRPVVRSQQIRCPCAHRRTLAATPLPRKPACSRRATTFGRDVSRCDRAAF